MESNYAPEIDHLARNEEQMEASADVLFFLLISLLVGCLLREFNKRTKFPYSPSVLFVGLLIGLYAAAKQPFTGEKESQENESKVASSILTFSYMHPHLILFVFIPILLFESAFNCDWYIFKKQGINMLLLAGPGVCWGAVILAVFFKVVLFYDMDWTLAFTLGSVLSATDPVAVVALLKELGASTKFNTLIEGEALLNDGTAMVFFLFFSGMYKGAEVGFFAVILQFFRSAVLGPIVGFLISLVGSYWMGKIIRDDTLSSILTFLLAYISFYLAEFTFLHTSGILTVISVGLFWSAFGKTRIYSGSEHAVHTIWGFCQYIAETLIFLQVGIIVGVQVLQSEYITGVDWVKLIIFYFLMLLGRYLMILTFLPLMRKSGYPISRQELIVTVYGGLRGALGLCLSLMVGTDDKLPVEFRNLTIFYTAGMATLTNLVNGTTCKFLVSYLNMIEESKVRLRLQTNFLKEAVLNIDEKQNELKSNKNFELSDWEVVEELSGVKSLQTNIDGATRQSLDNLSNIRPSKVQKDVEVLEEIRYRALRLMKGLIYEEFEKGMCEGSTCNVLVEQVNISIDLAKEPINVWENLYLAYTEFSSIQTMFKMMNYPVVGYFISGMINNHLAYIYDATTIFIMTVNEALHLINHLNLPKQYIAFVSEELKSELLKAESYLVQMTETFPQVLKSIQTKRAAYSILISQRAYIDEAHKDGQIDEKEKNQFQGDIDSSLSNLYSYPFNYEMPVFDRLVMQFPLFNNLSPAELKTLVNSTYELTFLPKQYVYEQGMTCQNLYIITRGNVEDHITHNYVVKLGLGSFISFANILQSKCVTTCVAVTKVVANCISVQVIRSLMEQNPVFEEKVYLSSTETFVHYYSHRSGPLSLLDGHRLKELLKHVMFRRCTVGQKINLLQGAFVYFGKVVKKASQLNAQSEVYEDFCYIEPSKAEFECQKPSYIAVFEKSIEDIINARAEHFGLNQHDANVDQIFQSRHPPTSHH